MNKLDINSSVLTDASFMKQSVKPKKQLDQNSCQFVWKRVDTTVGSFFKDKNIQIRAKRKTTDISEKEIIQVLHLSQTQAAKILNCSLSTLKRRFYLLKAELGLSTWPQNFREIIHLPIYKKMYPMSLEFILN